MSARIEEQGFRSSVDREFRRDRTGYGKRAHPFEVVGQIAESFAKGQARLQCVWAVASDSLRTEASDSQIRLAESSVSWGSFS
jgi:hypothetical protein